MRYFALIIALMFSACVFDTAYAQTARKTFRIGPKTDDDKELKFNRDSTTPPGILWDESDGKIKFSNDGTNYRDIGSGSGAGSGVNLLADFNSDFEAGTTSWTASGGTFSIGS